jgi:DNA-directed RNA polymerase subunit K/omega
MHHPPGMTGFEFAVMSGLRAAQLLRGCTPRVVSTHKLIVTAQMEVASGLIGRAPDAVMPGADKPRRL